MSFGRNCQDCLQVFDLIGSKVAADMPRCVHKCDNGGAYRFNLFPPKWSIFLFQFFLTADRLQLRR